MIHEEKKLSIICPTCKAVFKRTPTIEKKQPLAFCAYCGNRLHHRHKTHSTKTELQEIFSTVSIATEKAPEPTEIQTTIGQYQILKNIGKGGMGEVFLAYDTVSGRKIALKRIRADLLAHPQLQNRFLREARLTSQLMHPTIVPIYSIHQEDQMVYYTMPFVEGETLRQILKRARDQERKREGLKDPHNSIPSLVRIFLQVCQACAYAHSQGVLHRDLKPENFIIGKYGQVLILDWGLAKLIGEDDSGQFDAEGFRMPQEMPLAKITRLGKVVGTIAYMAPERALGKPATIQTDIYSLGVILYQILTLSLPFRRKNLAYFKSHWNKEQLIAPELLAPYREVPQILSEIVKKCLAVDPKARYQTIDELITSLENYLEGRSEWFPARTLDIHNKKDWQFQENVMIAEHTAITRATDISEWYNLMISEDSFNENTKIEAEVSIKDNGHGLGFLFSIPDATDRRQITDGYCLWLSSDREIKKKSKLLRSSINVFEASDIVLQRGKWYRIRIEKKDLHISFYINDQLQFTYVSHIPVKGTHIGLMAKDADFEVKNFIISVGSQNIEVACLAVPDAFLANKDYDQALIEYRRIGASFPGRFEGREAQFRAGITLLEKAKLTNSADLFSKAHEEFAKLRPTPGAPLEYLGKALIYNYLQDFEEEIKCYELALRRYKRHPLVVILEEEIAFRMQESSKEHRRAAYDFISLSLRFLPELSKTASTQKLLKSLATNWEVPFFFTHETYEDPELQKYNFSLKLAFWLAKPYLLYEILDELFKQPILPIPLINDTFFALLILGAKETVRKAMADIRALLSDAEQKRLQPLFAPIEIALHFPSPTTVIQFCSQLKQHKKPLSLQQVRLLYLMINELIQSDSFTMLEDVLGKIADCMVEEEFQEYFDAFIIRAYLLLNNSEKAARLLEKYDTKKLHNEKSPLYFLAACVAHKEKALTQFSKLLETPYPQTCILAAYFLTDKFPNGFENWEKRSFLWERRRLYEDLALFYHIAKDKEKEESFQMQAAKESIHEV